MLHVVPWLQVTIGSQQLSASHSVAQHVEVVEAAAKESRLLALLEKYHASRKNRVIVFVLYKKEAVRMEQLLQRKGWNVAAVHGDLSQQQRTQVRCAAFNLKGLDLKPHMRAAFSCEP